MGKGNSKAGVKHMANKELSEEVGRYIDKYYEPGTDDIRMDEEMKSIFDKITSFRKKRKEWSLYDFVEFEKMVNHKNERDYLC